LTGLVKYRRICHSQQKDHAMNQEHFTQQLADEGFDEIITKSMPAKQQVAAHSHAFEVKALVIQGDISLGIREQLKTYRMGDVFTMASGCEHTELYGESGVTYVVGRKHDRAGAPELP
jgi:quercetin dioxygenase-like cupin family protein